MDDKNVIAEILEAVIFLKDHAATKDELDALRQDMAQRMGGMEGVLTNRMGGLGQKIDAVKEGLIQRMDGIKDDLTTQVDGLVVLHKNDESERAAMLAKNSRLEDHVDQIAAHLQFKLS